MIWAFLLGLTVDILGNTPGMNAAAATVLAVSYTHLYLQLPVMAHWGFKLCDDVRLKLAVGPYVAVGIGGRTHAYVSSSKYNIDEETGVGQYEYLSLIHI